MLSGKIKNKARLKIKDEQVAAPRKVRFVLQNNNLTMSKSSQFPDSRLSTKDLNRLYLLDSTTSSLFRAI